MEDEPRSAQVHARPSVHAGLAGGPGAPLRGVRGAPGLGVWAAQRGVGSAALRVSSELVPMRGGAEGIWAGRWGASWDLGCRSWGRAAEAADRWSHVGAARHRGRDGCGSPSCHLESDRRSSQGSQFRRLTGPPPEAAHRTLDPTGPPVSAAPAGRFAGAHSQLGRSGLEIGHSWGCGSSQGPSPGPDYFLRFACASLAI